MIPKIEIGLNHLEVERPWKQLPKVPTFLVQRIFSVESVVIKDSEGLKRAH